MAELGNEPRCSENGFGAVNVADRVWTEYCHLRALWSQELSDNNISVVTCLTGSKERRWSGSGRECLRTFIRSACIMSAFLSGILN